MLRRIVVLGIGNLLLKDEGVGIHVIEALRKENFPENVELIDGAVSGLDILPLIENCDKLIIVDAVSTADTPGTIYKFKAQDINTKTTPPLSLHEIDIAQVLNLAGKYDKLPVTLLIGIVPGQISWGLELSPVVAERIPKLMQLVKEEINNVLTPGAEIHC